ncbi:hypothetical protein M098_4520 [Phocaeicola vulgatus str. 3775 SR(B) 19]|nr:hypothetical protein M098_4520 [Phocaeicola vulgatus str. 3775 SR(B) 19]
MGSAMNSWYKIYSTFICLNFSCTKIRKLAHIRITFEEIVQSI